MTKVLQEGSAHSVAAMELGQWAQVIPGEIPTGYKRKISHNENNQSLE